MISWHRVGQRVVCEFDGWRPCRGETCPEKGQVYTVRGVVLYPFDTGSSPAGPAFLLEEIVNPHQGYFGFWQAEAAFSACRFRPVFSTDISSLQQLAADITARGRVTEKV